jgi:hypothetical protein
MTYEAAIETSIACEKLGVRNGAHCIQERRCFIVRSPHAPESLEGCRREAPPDDRGRRVSAIRAPHNPPL